LGYNFGSMAKAFEEFSEEVRSNIGGREVAYMIFLTAFLMFLSLAIPPARVSGADITNLNGYKEGVVNYGYGSPFEMVSVRFPVGDYRGLPNLDYGGLMDSLLNQLRFPGTPDVLWAGLVADFTIFSLSAFMIIFAITKLKNNLEYSRYYS